MTQALCLKCLSRVTSDGSTCPPCAAKEQAQAGGAPIQAEAVALGTTNYPGSYPASAPTSLAAPPAPAPTSHQEFPSTTFAPGAASGHVHFGSGTSAITYSQYQYPGHQQGMAPIAFTAMPATGLTSPASLSSLAGPSIPGLLNANTAPGYHVVQQAQQHYHVVQQAQLEELSPANYTSPVPHTNQNHVYKP